MRLHTLRQGGSTERQISEALGLSLPRVGQLLLYQRWRTWARNQAVEVELSERRFRAYWHGRRWALLTQGKRRVDTVYEAEIFADIAAMLQAGKPPDKKPKPFKPKTAQELLKAAYPLTALRKEVQHRWDHGIRQDFVSLQRLLHFYGVPHAPTLERSYAQQLHQALQSLMTLLPDISEARHREVTRIYETGGLKETLQQLSDPRDIDRRQPRKRPPPWPPFYHRPEEHARAAQTLRRTMDAILRQLAGIDVDAAVWAERPSWNSHLMVYEGHEAAADFPYLSPSGFTSTTEKYAAAVDSEHSGGRSREPHDP